MKRSVGQGAIVLTVSGLLCKIIGAFFRLPLTYVLGVEGIGQFQLVMSVFAFALVITSGGISVSLSKLISTERARGNFGKIRWHIYVALCHVVVMSFFIGLLFFLFARNLETFQHAKGAGLSYAVFFPLLLLSSLTALGRGVFQGYENMTPSAVSQMIEQLGKFVFGLLFAFVFVRKSVGLGVLGAVIGIMIGEGISFIYFLLSRKSLGIEKYKIIQGSRQEFYSFFLPSTASMSISSFVHFFDSLVIVPVLIRAGLSGERATSLFGLQTGIVGSILNFPLIISLSLATSLLPNLSFEGAKSEGKLSKSFSIMWLCLLPITLGILAISLPLYETVYPFFSRDLFSFAVYLTAVGSVATLALSIAQFFSSILQARGEFRYLFFANLVGGVAKISCTLFLCQVPSISIIGLAIGNVLYAVIVMIFCLVKAKGSFSLSVDELFLPAIGSLAMLVAVSILAIALPTGSIVKLIICVPVGILIYICITFPLLKGVIRDIKGKKMFGRVNHEQKRTD